MLEAYVDPERRGGALRRDHSVDRRGASCGRLLDQDVGPGVQRGADERFVRRDPHRQAHQVEAVLLGAEKRLSGWIHRRAAFPEPRQGRGGVRMLRIHHGRGAEVAFAGFRERLEVAEVDAAVAGDAHDGDALHASASAS